MQVEIIQQVQKQHTQSIPQAMEYLQELPTSMREEVFHFIDFMRMRSDTSSTGVDSLDTLDKNKAVQPVVEEKPLMGSAIVELFADVSLTDDEVAIFDKIRKDDDSKSVSFD